MATILLFLIGVCPQISGQEGGRKNNRELSPPFPNHRGDKDAQKIIQPDIPPGHLVDPDHVPQDHLPGIAGADDEGPFSTPVLQPAFPG